MKIGFVAAAVVSAVALGCTPTGAPSTSTTTSSSTTSTSTSTTSSVPPSSTVDAQFLSGFGTWVAGISDCDGDSYEYAQTFVPLRSGIVDRVSVAAQPRGRPGGLSIRIVEADGAFGAPSGTQLGRGSYNGTGVVTPTDVVDVPLRVPASVQAGLKYALVFSTYTGLCPPPGSWRLGGNTTTTDLYTAGEMWSQTRPYTSWRRTGSTSDLFFRIWIL